MDGGTSIRGRCSTTSGSTGSESAARARFRRLNEALARSRAGSNPPPPSSELLKYEDRRCIGGPAPLPGLLVVVVVVAPRVEGPRPGETRDACRWPWAAEPGREAPREPPGERRACNGFEVPVRPPPASPSGVPPLLSLSRYWIWACTSGVQGMTMPLNLRQGGGEQRNVVQQGAAAHGTGAVTWVAAHVSPPLTRLLPKVSLPVSQKCASSPATASVWTKSLVPTASNCPGRGGRPEGSPARSWI